MQVKEVMTANPACCTADTPLPEVARLMVEHDCGEIPVVQNETKKIPVGVVTDRDIVCRTVAKDRNPLDLTAADCMTRPVVTVTPLSVRLPAAGNVLTFTACSVFGGESLLSLNPKSAEANT